VDLDAPLVSWMGSAFDTMALQEGRKDWLRHDYLGDTREMEWLLVHNARDGCASMGELRGVSSLGF